MNPFFRAQPRFRAAPPAFALVTTLLMVMAITGAAVAFFQATRLERLVSRNYSDVARAQLAAQSGVAAAQGLITSLFTNYPDSATGWARLTDTELCTFYFRTTDNTGFQATGANAANPASQPVFLFAYPLASGANAVQMSTFANSAAVFTTTQTPDGQAGLTAANSVDLNRSGWIGTPTPGGAQPVLKAKWIELLQDPTQAKNMNLSTTTGRPINPPVARYAFWAEDESFRVNLNWAGSTVRGNNTPGASPKEIVLQAALQGQPQSTAQEISKLVEKFGTNFPTPATMATVPGAPANFYPDNKFVVTTLSSALNFSRGGIQRVNLNQVVPATDTAATPAMTIRSELDRIIATITHQSGATVAGNRKTAAMPLFGQRFYKPVAYPFANSNLASANLNSTNGIKSTDACGANSRTNLYLQKIAANIRDYIDTDAQPTVVLNNPSLQVRGNSQSFMPLNGTSVTGNTATDTEVAAFGKEAVPLLTEFAIRGLLKKLTPGASTADFEFDLIFYFEFWNPTSKDIPVASLGNPSLRIMNLFNWDVGTGTIDPATPPVLNIPLTQFGVTTFPANSFTVLTTESAGDSTCPFPNGNTFKRANAPITYRGTTSVKANNKYRVRPKLGTAAGRAGTTVTDYDLWMVLFNANGPLESFTALPTADTVEGSDNAFTLHNDNNSNLNVATFKTRCGSLRGTDVLSRSGEPRSLNEQMTIVRYNGSTDFDQTRFFTTDVSTASLGSLGTFVDPKSWPDYSPAITPVATLAPYSHRDGALDSIGRLGDVYDPVLILTGGTTDITKARGGGRTLKVGQSEAWVNGTALANSATGGNPYGLWDGSETSFSRNMVAWRLADLFCVTPPDRNGNGAVDADELTRIDGQININGALRDNGLALQALVQGLSFESSPSGASATSGRPLTVANFTNAIGSYLSGGPVDQNPANDRIFWERGQLGELADTSSRPLFNYALTGGSNAVVSGVSLATTQDRGREELVRRVMELVCTKGNTYTVYAVGQALNPQTGLPLATHRIKRTFRISPVFNPALPGDGTFLAANAGQDNPADRFRRPSSFALSILQNSQP